MKLDAAMLEYLRLLKAPKPLPAGVEVLHPYRNPVVWSLCKQFYERYYHDQGERRLILGINPGRWGAGLTGIPFTDPALLEQVCGIPNDLDRRPELSATFVYEVIAACGGPETFYRSFLIGSVCPLGFVKDGKNLNYYDLPALARTVRPWAVRSIRSLLAMNIRADVAYCLGEGDNFRYLTALNAEGGFFQRVVALPHPRFVMQYRRKRMAEYIAKYREALFNAPQ
ncbi:MAG: DUF4918 family protein [Cyclobacteriaceae bacterium]|nr:DUF4918 family protein [Cyclobacteriaceae bacterium]